MVGPMVLMILCCVLCCVLCCAPSSTLWHSPCFPLAPFTLFTFPLPPFTFIHFTPPTPYKAIDAVVAYLLDGVLCCALLLSHSPSSTLCCLLPVALGPLHPIHLPIPPLHIYPIHTPTPHRATDASACLPNGPPASAGLRVCGFVLLQKLMESNLHLKSPILC